PAANPSSRNTIIPQGEIPSARSSSQPIPAPKPTPATSSADKRKPRAIAEGSAVGGGPGALCEGRAGWWGPGRSPRRWGRAGEAGLRVAGPFAEPLQPRGERSLVRFELVVILGVARVVGHAFDTRLVFR